MNLKQLIAFLKNQDTIYIQPHDFPDPDAVATSYGLQQLLAKTGIQSDIIYHGDMQRNALLKMVHTLDIPLIKFQENVLEKEAKILIVDGCIGNQNVTHTGEEVAVIDHHLVKEPDEVFFVDIRPDVGSCSSIIWSYYQELEINISPAVATALLIGMNMDTALMTRKVSALDLDAFSFLYKLADIQIVNSIIRNNIKFDDLSYFKFAIEHLKLYKKFAFCYFPDGCDQNLLGILGDFLLTMDEVDFVALCALNGDAMNFSLRSEKKNWDASWVIKDVLQGMGFGGGHMEMAGGAIRNILTPNIQHIYKKFIDSLGLS